MTTTITAVNKDTKVVTSISDKSVIKITPNSSKVTITACKRGTPGVSGGGIQQVFYDSIQPDFKGYPGIWIEKLSDSDFTFWIEDGL